MKFDDPKWQETVDAQTLSDLKGTLKVLADDAWHGGYAAKNGDREQEAEADRRVEVSKASILRLVDSIMRTSRAKNQTRKSNAKGGDEMMWTKTGSDAWGLDTWEAKNGSGFVAHVRDMKTHFLVSTPGSSLATRMVDANSLDALKLEVQRMAVESLVAS